MHTSKWIAVMTAATMLTACSEPMGEPGHGVLQGGNVNKQDIGTLAGAIGGGVIGSTIGRGSGAVAATIGGALLGGMLGSNIGASMDRRDVATYDRASYDALESGREQRWASRSNYGEIHPYNTFHDSYGRYCREYDQTIVIDGRSHTGYGTACREEDGTWQIVS